MKTRWPIFKEIIEAYPDVRWTFCITHSPPYYSPAVEKDPGNFARIEAMLADRPFTVFSAHTHTYNYDQRDGHDFITTATSGAMNVVRPGAMDHVVWITMTKEGPKIINLLMNGMIDKQGPPEGRLRGGILACTDRRLNPAFAAVARDRFYLMVYIRAFRSYCFNFRQSYGFLARNPVTDHPIQ